MFPGFARLIRFVSPRFNVARHVFRKIWPKTKRGWILLHWSWWNSLPVYPELSSPGQLVVPEDNTVRRELLTEAEFYQVQGIINELKARPFKDSVILSSDQQQTLINWLKETLTSASCDYALKYRASRNGWAAANFHSCCDNKGPTVTVVKCGNYILGGYTDQSWESHGRTIFEGSTLVIIAILYLRNM